MGVGSGGWCPSPGSVGARGLWNYPEQREIHRGYPTNPFCAGSSLLAESLSPARFYPGFYRSKKTRINGKKTPTRAGPGGCTWGPPPDVPFIPPGRGSVPSSSKTTPGKPIFWEPFRLPAGCRRLLLSQGLFLLPGSLTGLLPGRFPHPSFSFPARGPWEEGMPVSIAMRLALIRVSSLGGLITESVAK